LLSFGSRRGHLKIVIPISSPQFQSSKIPIVPSNSGWNRCRHWPAREPGGAVRLSHQRGPGTSPLLSGFRRFHIGTVRRVIPSPDASKPCQLWRGFFCQGRLRHNV
jgi:hypothetical protein